MRLFIFILLISYVLTQTVIVYSDPSLTTLTEPSEQLSSLQKYHDMKHPSYLGNEAKWIWADNPSSKLSNTFQALFHVDCPQVFAVLRITADGFFTAYLNDGLVGSGEGLEQVYLLKLKLSCGRNHLKVTVTNKDKRPHPGLIFAIVQDQTKCYDCQENPSAFYNRDTCQCQCSTQCGCRHELQKWIGYPSCGCKCNVYTFAACNPLTRFWDETSCACKCKRTLCPYGFTQDPQSCKCVCKQQKCSQGTVWNSNKCWCQACVPQKCKEPKFWHQGMCSCVCPLLFVPCPNGQNPVTCECYPTLKSEGCTKNL